MSERTSRELDGYLDRMRESGDFDSQGFFTVAGLRAVGKLARFLLEKESDWVLKFVQCACAADCPELRIKQTRVATQFHFTLPYAVQLTDFERSLIQAKNTTEQPGLEDLTAALRAVGLGQKRNWVAKLNTPSKETLISCSEGKVSAEQTQSESDHGPGTMITVGVSYPRGQSGKVAGLIRFGEAVQSEHETLRERARCCPIPLYMDGVRLDDLTTDTLRIGLENKSFLGISGTPDSGPSALRVPEGILRVESFQIEDRFADPAPFYAPHIEPRSSVTSLQCWYFNFTTSRENLHKSGFFFQAVPTPSRVFLIRRGVVVGCRYFGLRHPISVDIYLRADNLKSDLTGLRVDITDTEMQIAGDEILGSGEFLQGLSQVLRNHNPRPLKQQMLLYGSLGALGLMSPFFALKAVAGTVSTLMLANSARNHRKVVSECVRQLEDFRAWLSTKRPSASSADPSPNAHLPSEAPNTFEK